MALSQNYLRDLHADRLRAAAEFRAIGCYHDALIRIINARVIRTGSGFPAISAIRIDDIAIRCWARQYPQAGRA